MVVIGITGNIGCGKSTVSNILIERGYKVVDADIISREIMKDEKTLSEIKRNFGESVILEDGSLDRAKLGSIVFSDDNELIKLNNITHPIIKQKTLDQIKCDRKIVFVDGALLVEANFLDILDKLIVIICDQKIQIQRITQRDKCSIEECKKRINVQMNQEEKIKYSDYTIDNSSDKYELENKVNEMIEHIKEKWCV